MLTQIESRQSKYQVVESDMIVIMTAQIAYHACFDYDRFIAIARVGPHATGEQRGVDLLAMVPGASCSRQGPFTPAN